MTKLSIIKVVPDTFTNASGSSLAIQLEKFLINNDPVEVSLSDTLGMSSSFFNSSFGHLIDKYGFTKVKEGIKITGVKSTQAQLLRNFFDSYKNYH